DGLPSLRTNRTRLRRPEPSPRLLPLRTTLRPLCRLPPLPPAHLIPSCHSESALAVRNLLFPPVVSGKRGAPRVSPLLRPGIPAQKAVAPQAIESGRLQREEDAIQEALALWEARERSRAEILTAVDAAEASLAAGKGRVITDQSMRELAAEVKQHGRARLASEQSRR